MTYIVGFNGPPHCGKDTISDALAEYLRNSNPQLKVGRNSLSLPMRIIGFNMLARVYSPVLYEQIKDEPQDMFDGDTLRRFMINFSETFVKPNYGTDTWAKNLMKRLETFPHDVVIVSDIGFQAECDYFDYLAQNLIGYEFLTVQLEREGTDWSKDSRGYCSGEYLLRVSNNAGIREIVDNVVGQMLRMGWVL